MDVITVLLVGVLPPLALALAASAVVSGRRIRREWWRVRMFRATGHWR